MNLLKNLSAVDLVSLLRSSLISVEEYQEQPSEHILLKDLVSAKFQILSVATIAFLLCAAS